MPEYYFIKIVNDSLFTVKEEKKEQKKEDGKEKVIAQAKEEKGETEEKKTEKEKEKKGKKAEKEDNDETMNVSYLDKKLRADLDKNSADNIPEDYLDYKKEPLIRMIYELVSWEPKGRGKFALQVCGKYELELKVVSEGDKDTYFISDKGKTLRSTKKTSEEINEILKKHEPFTLEKNAICAETDSCLSMFELAAKMGSLIAEIKKRK